MVQETIPKEVRNGIIAAITANRDESFLNTMFKTFNVRDTKVKESILLEAMGNPEIGFMGSPAKEARYETIVHIFLSGEWQD